MHQPFTTAALLEELTKNFMIYSTRLSFSETIKYRDSLISCFGLRLWAEPCDEHSLSTLTVGSVTLKNRFRISSFPPNVKFRRFFSPSH